MPETIQLPGSGRHTTRIGFGGSGLMGGLSQRESLRLLETAFDAGIRHFDVAPSYGHGMAERCLGKFLRGKADRVTIATKFGILPPQAAGLLDAARTLARPLVRRVPSLRKGVAQAAASLKTKARFSAKEARRSLEHSLRELGVERLDLWLLHEATADDLDRSDLLLYMQKEQQQGRVGMFGIGGEHSHLDALWQRHRAYCRVLQFQWPVCAAAPDFPGALHIYFRAVSGGQTMLKEWFKRDPQLCRRWSTELDADLANPEVLAALLLRTALSANPDGMVLFSSRVPAHILSNVGSADDPVWAAPAQRFLQSLRKRDALAGTNFPISNSGRNL